MTLSTSVLTSGEHPKTLTKRIKPLSGVRVLVVEDEILQALALENIIAELGGCVLANAYSFEQAMKVIKNAKFDCAVLDINLSHHKGIGDFVCTDYCLQIHVF